MRRVLMVAALLAGITARPSLAQDPSPTRATVDSATIANAQAFASRIRVLLDSQNVVALSRMVAPPNGPHRRSASISRFVGSTQILSATEGELHGVTSGLSIMVVSPDLLVVSSIDDTKRPSAEPARRAWTALVSTRGGTLALLHLHVSNFR